MGVTLFPHQIEACEGADKLYANGAKNVLMVLPTGSGKTLVKAEYARRAYVRHIKDGDYQNDSNTQTTSSNGNSRCGCTQG